MIKNKIEEAIDEYMAKQKTIEYNNGYKKGYADALQTLGKILEQKDREYSDEKKDWSCWGKWLVVKREGLRVKKP